MPVFIDGIPNKFVFTESVPYWVPAINHTQGKHLCHETPRLHPAWYLRISSTFESWKPIFTRASVFVVASPKSLETLTQEVSGPASLGLKAHEILLVWDLP